MQFAGVVNAIVAPFSPKTLTAVVKQGKRERRKMIAKMVECTEMVLKRADGLLIIEVGAEMYTSQSLLKAKPHKIPSKFAGSAGSSDGGSWGKNPR